MIARTKYGQAFDDSGRNLIKAFTTSVYLEYCPHNLGDMATWPPAVSCCADEIDYIENAHGV